MSSKQLILCVLICLHFRVVTQASFLAKSVKKEEEPAKDSDTTLQQAIAPFNEDSLGEKSPGFAVPGLSSSFDPEALTTEPVAVPAIVNPVQFSGLELFEQNLFEDYQPRTGCESGPLNSYEVEILEHIAQILRQAQRSNRIKGDQNNEIVHAFSDIVSNAHFTYIVQESDIPVFVKVARLLKTIFAKEVALCSRVFLEVSTQQVFKHLESRDKLLSGFEFVEVSQYLKIILRLRKDLCRPSDMTKPDFSLSFFILEYYLHFNGDFFALKDIAKLTSDLLTAMDKVPPKIEKALEKLHSVRFIPILGREEMLGPEEMNIVNEFAKMLHFCYLRLLMNLKRGHTSEQSIFRLKNGDSCFEDDFLKKNLDHIMPKLSKLIDVVNQKVEQDRLDNLKIQQGLRVQDQVEKAVVSDQRLEEFIQIPDDSDDQQADPLPQLNVCAQVSDAPFQESTMPTSQIDLPVQDPVAPACEPNLPAQQPILTHQETITPTQFSDKSVYQIVSSVPNHDTTFKGTDSPAQQSDDQSTNQDKRDPDTGSKHSSPIQSENLPPPSLNPTNKVPLIEPTATGLPIHLNLNSDKEPARDTVLNPLVKIDSTTQETRITSAIDDALKDPKETAESQEISTNELTINQSEELNKNQTNTFGTLSSESSSINEVQGGRNSNGVKVTDNSTRQAKIKPKKKCRTSQSNGRRKRNRQKRKIISKAMKKSDSSFGEHMIKERSAQWRDSTLKAGDHQNSLGTQPKQNIFYPKEDHASKKAERAHEEEPQQSKTVDNTKKPSNPLGVLSTHPPEIGPDYFSYGMIFFMFIVLAFVTITGYKMYTGDFTIEDDLPNGPLLCQENLRHIISNTSFVLTPRQIHFL